MPPFDVPDLPSHFRRLLGECRELYLSSAKRIVDEHPQMLAESVETFTERMDDLHRGLLVKIFVTICESDRRWSQNERFLAEVLVFHLWSRWLEGDALQEAISAMSEKAMALKWYAVIRPFDQIAPLRNRVGELETLVVRLANIIARADGPMKLVETAQVKSCQDEWYRHLREIPIDDPDEREQANEARIETIKKILHDSNRLPGAQPSATATQEDKCLEGTTQVAIEAEASGDQQQAKPSPEQLEEALAELDRLIGLDNIKHEVRTLTNFLKVQRQREEAQLPTTNLTLHMVFGGNPGTGKTTVARIVGKVFGAMGVLKKGHLIETDRSGLVAEYAGQTGPKTNKQIDEALDAMPSAGSAAFLSSCSHTTFSPNVVDGGLMKTNVIPDTIYLDVDVRTLPGETSEDVAAHLRTALGDLADSVEIDSLLSYESTMSRIDTPLWDSLTKAVSKPFPSARLSPQFLVGFTDSRVYRNLGGVAYGAGLFSPDLDAGDFSTRFHGNDERIDVESLQLTTQLWVDVVTDFLG